MTHETDIIEFIKKVVLTDDFTDKEKVELIGIAVEVIDAAVVYDGSEDSIERD